jgi:hypothetical protein
VGGFFAYDPSVATIGVFGDTRRVCSSSTASKVTIGPPSSRRGTFEFRAPNGSATPPAECDPGEEPPAKPPADRPPQPPQPSSGGQAQASPPSNMFVVKRVKVGRRGVSTHVVELPGPGTLEVVASARARSPRVRGTRRPFHPTGGQTRTGLETFVLRR